MVHIDDYEAAVAALHSQPRMPKPPRQWSMDYQLTVSGSCDRGRLSTRWHDTPSHSHALPTMGALLVQKEDDEQWERDIEAARAGRLQPVFSSPPRRSVGSSDDTRVPAPVEAVDLCEPSTDHQAAPNNDLWYVPMSMLAPVPGR